MQNRSVGDSNNKVQAGFSEKGRENGMTVALVAVVCVLWCIRALKGIVTRMAVFMMMIMIVNMEACGRHVLSYVPMHACCRGPGELERNDEHDDEGNEAVHGVHSTEFD